MLASVDAAFVFGAGFFTFGFFGVYCRNLLALPNRKAHHPRARGNIGIAAEGGKKIEVGGGAGAAHIVSVVTSDSGCNGDGSNCRRGRTSASAARARSALLVRRRIRALSVTAFACLASRVGASVDALDL